MKTVKSESGHYPKLLDTETSATTVYERENVVEIEREGQIYYQYTERQYEVGEWLQKRLPLMLMSRIEALEAESVELKTALLDKQVLKESDFIVKEEPLGPPIIQPGEI